MQKLRPPKRNADNNNNIKSFRNPEEEQEQSNQQNYEVYLLAEPQQVQNAAKGQATYIWIDKRIRTQQYSKYFKQLSQNIQIQGFSSISDAKSLIKDIKWEFKIICQIQCLHDIVQKYGQDDRLVQIYVFFNATTQSKNGFNKKTTQQLKFKQHPKLMIQTNSIKQLQQKINKYRLIGNTKAILPNFTKITNNSDLSEVNYSRMAIHMLLLCKNLQKGKQDFVNLAKFTYSNQKDVTIYQNQYMQNCSSQIAIKQYTKKTFYYQLINDTLKSSLTLPLNLGYVRFPVCHLYKAIKNLFKKQNLIHTNFTCYRGGYIHKHELEYFLQNQKGFIQVQGFLSASTFVEIAQQFAGNCLFIIKVKQAIRDQQADHGFCHLNNNKKLTNFQNEGQVLFNILNVMQIISVKKTERKGKKLFEIQLEYGSLSQIISKRKNSIALNLEQRKCLINYESIKKNLKLIANQGDCFRFMNQFTLAMKFYSNFIQGYRKNKFKLDQKLISAYNNLAAIYFQKQEFSNAQKCYQKVKTFLQTEKPKQYHRKSAIQNSLGLIKSKQGQYEKALQHYGQAEKLIKNNYGQSSQQLISIYNNMAGLYYKINQKNLAIQFYEKALSLIKNECPNIKIANLYSNVALIYNQKRNYQKALVYFQKSLQIYNDIKGQNDVQTANIHQMIGNTYKFNQESTLALKHLMKAYQSKSIKLGQFHRQVKTLKDQIQKVRNKNSNFVYIPQTQNNYHSNEKQQTGLLDCLDDLQKQIDIKKLFKKKQRQALSMKKLQFIKQKQVPRKSERSKTNNGTLDTINSYLTKMQDIKNDSELNKRYQQKQQQSYKQNYGLIPQDIMDTINIDRAKRRLQRYKLNPNLNAKLIQ